MEEFSEKDDVTLSLHTYLFMGADPYNPQTIRDRIEEFVEEELSFPDRDLIARPLPWANLLILSHEIEFTRMPALYKSFQAFVLPTHGEGSGRTITRRREKKKITRVEWTQESLTHEINLS